MFKLCFFILIAICSFCIREHGKLNSSSPTEAGEAEAAETQSPVNGSVTAKILPSEAGGFGYEIYINGIKSIEQPCMPVVTGYRGFPDSTKAAKVAALVIAKIYANKLPPSVSRKEMDSLGVF